MITSERLRWAVDLIWPHLPELVDDDWADVEPQLLDALAGLDDADPVSTARVLAVLLRHSAVQERLGPLLDPGAWATRGTPVDEPASGPAARSVNTLVAPAGADTAASRLLPATDYEVLLNIGPHQPDSLLPDTEARWPDELLPDGGLWLRAVLFLGNQARARTVPFFLGPAGESFHCGCTPDGPHDVGCIPQRWVRFPWRTPEEPATVDGELVVYHQAAAVVAVRLHLPSGEPLRSPRAWLAGRLTSSFNDLGKLAGRTASVVASGGSGRVVVNGTGFLDNPFAIGAGAADTSAFNARTALFNSHFERRGDTLLSRYGAGRDAFDKDYDAYEKDLRRLAREGAELYTALFRPPGSDNTVAFTLPALIRHEARVRGRPPVIQIVDDRFDEHAMLWSLIYDLPVGSDPERYQVCPAAREFGPGGNHSGPIPPLCPHEDTHRGRGDMLCPYGFWGLSCLLEQPPTVGRDLAAVVGPAGDAVTVLAAVGGSLDTRLTEQHFTRLSARLPDPALRRPPATRPEQLAALLGPEAMDVVYFYCHCGYDRRSPGAAADRYLDLGGYTVQPLDITMWARTVWPDPHWSSRRPLVLLNGCHTAEATSGTLNAFVPAFTEWAGASGVVGTEITVEQELAGRVMEELLAGLLDGQSLGVALHATRWAMLARGNVIGLAYTAYSFANLTLRPSVAGQE